MKRALALIGLLFAGATEAYAQDQIVGVGSAYWNHRVAISTTTSCIKTSTQASAACALFLAGRGAPNRSAAVVITTDAAARCAWAGKPALDISSTCMISDPPNSGPGACIDLPAAGSQADEKPNWATMIARGAAGMRTGICSVAVNSCGFSVYAPCSVNGDCTSYGGGTCTAAGSQTDLQKANVAVFLNCEANTGTANISARKQEVQRY